MAASLHHAARQHQFAVRIGPIVRGAPYSGEGLTTVTQTLGDGTRIERTTTARLSRDSEGRTRREQTIIGPPEVLDAARRLDKHYIPSRYPSGFAASYPGKLYTHGEAEHAIADATLVAGFCRRHLPGQESAD